MTYRTQGVPEFVGLDYSVNLSKVSLVVYLTAYLTNSNSIGLLTVVDGLLLVRHVK